LGDFFLAIFFIASLSVSQLLLESNPEGSFFRLESRLWEMLIGAFSALYLTSPKKDILSGNAVHVVGSWLGLGMITFAVFFYRESTPFPGIFALVPTIGAVLVIIFASEDNFVGWLLGRKLLVVG